MKEKIRKMGKIVKNVVVVDEYSIEGCIQKKVRKTIGKSKIIRKAWKNPEKQQSGIKKIIQSIEDYKKILHFNKSSRNDQICRALCILLGHMKKNMKQLKIKDARNVKSMVFNSIINGQSDFPSEKIYQILFRQFSIECIKSKNNIKELLNDINKAEQKYMNVEGFMGFKDQKVELSKILDDVLNFNVQQNIFEYVQSITRSIRIQINRITQETQKKIDEEKQDVIRQLTQHKNQLLHDIQHHKLYTVQIAWLLQITNEVERFLDKDIKQSKQLLLEQIALKDKIYATLENYTKLPVQEKKKMISQEYLRQNIIGNRYGCNCHLGQQNIINFLCQYCSFIKGQPLCDHVWFKFLLQESSIAYEKIKNEEKMSVQPIGQQQNNPNGTPGLIDYLRQNAQDEQREKRVLQGKN